MMWGLSAQLVLSPSPPCRGLGTPLERETFAQFLFQRVLCLDSVLFPLSGVSAPLPEVVPWHLGTPHHLVEQERGSVCSPALKELPGGKESVSAPTNISLSCTVVFTVRTISWSSISRVILDSCYLLAFCVSSPLVILCQEKSGEMILAPATNRCSEKSSRHLNTH